MGIEAYYCPYCNENFTIVETELKDYHKPERCVWCMSDYIIKVPKNNP